MSLHKKEIGTHSIANISTYALRARSISLTRKKNMAAVSELLLQMVLHLHTTESEDVPANEGRQKRT